MPRGGHAGATMKLPRTAVTGWLLIVGVAIALQAGSAPLSGLRVYATQPAVFDYLFTSVSQSAGGTPVLAFNHRNGRTFFVHVGDGLDGYIVAAHEPRVRRVRIPATNSYREEKADDVILHAPDGGIVRLQLGQTLPEPGWMAHLVVVESGEWCLAKTGDVVPLAGTKVGVLRISENGVTLEAGGVSQEVATVTAEERQQLAKLWDRRREEAERERVARQQRREDVEREEAARMAARPQIQSQPVRRVAPASAMGFGTEFRYPTEFQLIPAVVDSSGRVIQPAIVIPKSFGVRSSGISFQAH